MTGLGAGEASIIVEGVPGIRHLEIAEQISSLLGLLGIHQREDLHIELLGDLDAMTAHMVGSAHMITVTNQSRPQSPNLTKRGTDR